MTVLPAGEPIIDGGAPVGHRTISLDVDGRPLECEAWYPASSSRGDASTYEVIPGVALRSAVALEGVAPADGRHPLVVLSHGRTGTRVSYSQFCEALAASGAVVVAPDHAGDTLGAWLSGAQLDDRGNEEQRLADVRAVIDAVLRSHPGLPVDVAGAIDRRHVAVVGHSYGAYSAFAAVAGHHGIPAHPAVSAVVGLQPYLRSLGEATLARVGVATMLVVGGTDDVTPAATDADRGWALVPGRPAWRLDLPRSGHQACSDIALYAELVEHVPELPQLVRDYLRSTAAGTCGPGVRPWRDVLREQVVAVWVFLSAVFAGDERPEHRLDPESDSVLHRR